MAFEGMDVEAVEALASQLHAQGENLESISGAVSLLVEHSGHVWQGSHAEQFAGEWHQHYRPRMLEAMTAMQDLAVAAARNAGAQRAVSGMAASAADHVAGLTPMPIGAVGVSALVAGRAARGSFKSSVQTPAQAIVSAAHKWAEGPTMTSSQSVDAGVSGHTSHDRHGSLYGVPLDANASASGYANAYASNIATLSRHGLDQSAMAGAGMGLALTASAMAGNQYANAKATVGVSGDVSAKVNDKVHVGPDGETAEAGFKAQATVEANASADADLIGAHGGATGHAYAGMGAHAHVSESITANEIKANVDFGAALGLGLGMTATIDIRPSETLSDIKHLVSPHIDTSHWFGR